MAEDERSSIWSMAAASSLAAGTAYGLYKSKTGLHDVFNMGRMDVAKMVSNRAGAMPGFRMARNIQSTLPPVHQLSFTDYGATAVGLLEGYNPIGKRDIAVGVFESLLSTGTIAQDDAYKVYKNILALPSALDAYEYGRQYISKMGGDAAILTRKLERVAPGGFYDPLRYAAFTGHTLPESDLAHHSLGKHIAISKGEFGKASPIDITRRAVGIPELTVEAQTLARKYQQQFSDILQGAPAQVKEWKYYNIADVMGGRGTTPMMVGELAGQKITIPLAATGVTYGGEHLTTRYATRGAWTAGGGEVLDYGEYYVRSILGGLEGQKPTQLGLKQAVIDANHALVESLYQRDSATRAAAIYTLPEAVATSGGRVRARLSQLEAVYGGPGRLAEESLYDVVGSTARGEISLWPFGSPSAVAGGTLTTRDIRQGLYGPLGEFFPVERRPTQFIRSEWGLTGGAKQIASNRPFGGAFGKAYSRLDRKIKGSMYEQLIYGGASAADPTAYSAAQLVSFYAKPAGPSALGGIGFKSEALRSMLSPEEALISKAAAGMMEYEKVVPQTLLVGEELGYHAQIKQALQGKRVGELVTFGTPIGPKNIIDEGRAKVMPSYLGITERGRELWARSDPRLVTEAVAAEIVAPDKLKLYMREKHKLTPGEYWKFFGEDIKHLGRTVEATKITSALGAAGAAGVPGVVGQDIEMFLSAEAIKKNPFALMSQQMEAMSMIAGQRLDTGDLTMRGRIAAREFLADPMAYLRVSNTLERSGAEAYTQLQQKMVSLARRKWHFTEQEMALTFGLMNSGVAERLGIGHAVATSPGVVGLSKLRLGQLGREGGIASFERQMFDVLSMKGDEGRAYAAELATRIRGTGELPAVDRMLLTMTGQDAWLNRVRSMLGAGTVPMLGTLTPEELFQAEGRMVDIGRKVKEFGGASKLYIPGLTEAPQLYASALTEKGMTIESPLMRSIREFHEASIAKAPEEIEYAARGLREATHAAVSAQAIPRGKVLGSRFLTGIRQVGPEAAEGIFRISPRHAEDMFGELIDAAKTTAQREFLESEKSRLLAGKTLTGGMWRFPGTSPESFQFVRYAVDTNLAEGMVSAPSHFGKIVLKGAGEAGKDVVREIDLSQMVGFKGDFDRDIFAISAISERDTANRVKGKITKEIEKDYTEYLFRHYAMKHFVESREPTVAAALGGAEVLREQTRKLVGAKITTGRVNLALQKLKLGVMAAAPEEYRPLAELFWHMEEAAIGSKHRVEAAPIYREITRAVETKSKERLSSVIQQLMGREQQIISGEIIRGIPSEKIAMSTPHKMTYEAGRWADIAMRSMMAVEDDVEVAFNTARAAMKGGAASRADTQITVSMLTEQIFNRKQGSLDPAIAAMQSASYGPEGVTQGVNRLLRDVGTKKRVVTDALRKAKAPIALGAAIGTAVMLSAPSAAGVLSKNRVTSEGAAGGANITADDMGPPSGFGISPPDPRIMTPKKIYDVGGTKLSSHANIRMRLDDLEVSKRDVMRHARDLSRSGRVRIKIADNRDALDAQMLASKIHERL
jgi:hypothetical protein